MPEINYIPYESAEDLNKYLYDNYYSTEMLEVLTTQTGIVNTNIFELELNTGISQNSISEVYYNLNYFNPLYSEAVWKCYLNSMRDCFIFFGYKETIAEPTLNMTESHAGFIISGGKLYASVADGDTQQRVENFKIAYNKFYIMPLPVVEEELSLPHILSIDRVWKEYVQLTNYPPENKVHWIVQFIKNSVGAEKYIKFNRFIYKEVYAD